MAKRNLKDGKIDIVKEPTLLKIFGSLKRKMNGQEFKDIIRKGWK